MSVDVPSPEIGRTIRAGEIETNYHDHGEGHPIVLLHGSGPGVSAYANWRLNIGPLSERFRVIAPDAVGFGYTERPDGIEYNRDAWVRHLRDFLDALGLERVGLVGNSFGGALTLAFTCAYPERVDRFVLMGSAGLSFELTPALDEIWGYTPSLENMERLLKLMAYDLSLMSPDLARVRYAAASRPGVHEAYAAMFPEPRQASIDRLATPEDEIKKLSHEVLIMHGRDDRILPMDVSLRLFKLIDRAQIHMFGRCGHWTQIEHARRFNALVGNFFAEAEGKSAGHG